MAVRASVSESGWGGTNHDAGNDAALFGISATLVYGVISSTNSSPQTTELFANQRSGTLWKYVRLGIVQAGVLVGIMAIVDHSWWPVFGGGLAGAAMWKMYDHALIAGDGQKPPILPGQGGGSAA